MIEQHYYCWFQCTWIGWFLLASFCCCCYPVDAFGVAGSQHSAASRLVVEGGSSDRFGLRKCQLDRGTNQISPRWNGGHQEIKEEEDEDEDATYLTDSYRRRLMHQVLMVGIATTPTTALVLLSRDSPCLALSPDEASSAYNSYAAQYDQLDGGDASKVLGITQARSQLMRRAKGNVLEIGVGTGLNLEYYDPERITSLTLVDISDGMLAQTKQRIETLQQQQQQQQHSWNDVSVTFVRADATRDLVKSLLQVGDNRSSMFDTVVDTFSLCVMGNDGARQCLNQLRNVVQDVDHGGQILLLENSKSSQPLLGWYQDLTAESAATMGGKGCVYNQDVRALIQSVEGLTIESEEAYATGLFRAFVCTKRTALSSS